MIVREKVTEIEDYLQAADLGLVHVGNRKLLPEHSRSDVLWLSERRHAGRRHSRGGRRQRHRSFDRAGRRFGSSRGCRVAGAKPGPPGRAWNRGASSRSRAVFRRRDCPPVPKRSTGGFAPGRRRPSAAAMEWNGPLAEAPYDSFKKLLSIQMVF